LRLELHHKETGHFEWDNDLPSTKQRWVLSVTSKDHVLKTVLVSITKTVFNGWKNPVSPMRCCCQALPSLSKAALSESIWSEIFKDQHTAEEPIELLNIWSPGNGTSYHLTE